MPVEEVPVSVGCYGLVAMGWLLGTDSLSDP